MNDPENVNISKEEVLGILNCIKLDKFPDLDGYIPGYCGRQGKK